MTVEQLLTDLLSQAPASAAIVVVVVMFLRFLVHERKARDEMMKLRHEQFMHHIERGHEIQSQVSETVKENTAQMARTSLVMDQTAELLRSFNGSRSHASEGG